MSTKTCRKPLLTNQETAFSPHLNSLRAVQPSRSRVARILTYLHTHPLGCEIAARRIQDEAC